MCELYLFQCVLKYKSMVQKCKSQDILFGMPICKISTKPNKPSNRILFYKFIVKHEVCTSEHFLSLHFVPCVKNAILDRSIIISSRKLNTVLIVIFFLHYLSRNFIPVHMLIYYVSAMWKYQGVNAKRFYLLLYLIALKPFSHLLLKLSIILSLQ